MDQALSAHAPLQSTLSMNHVIDFVISLDFERAQLVEEVSN